MNNQDRLRKYRREYARKWYQKTKLRTRERRRLWSIKRRMEIREIVIAAYGGKCSLCSETRALTVDHINGGGHFERKHFGTQFYYRLIKLGFPKDKYRCLCMNCNWEEGQKRIRKFGRKDLLLERIKTTRKFCLCGCGQSVFNSLHCIPGHGIRIAQRMRRKQTHCKNGHELNKTNARTYKFKDGHIQRVCRSCERIRGQQKRKLKI